MKMRARSYLKRMSGGIIAAFAIGLSVVAACNTAWAIAKGRPALALWGDATAFQVIIASAPFLLLALFGIAARRAWLVAVGATAVFWGYYAYAIIRPAEGVGANIGLGIVMMFSPLAVAVVSLLSLLTGTARGR